MKRSIQSYKGHCDSHELLFRNFVIVYIGYEVKKILTYLSINTDRKNHGGPDPDPRNHIILPDPDLFSHIRFRPYLTQSN